MLVRKRLEKGQEKALWAAAAATKNRLVQISVAREEWSERATQQQQAHGQNSSRKRRKIVGAHIDQLGVVATQRNSNSAN